MIMDELGWWAFHPVRMRKLVLKQQVLKFYILCNFTNALRPLEFQSLKASISLYANLIVLLK